MILASIINITCFTVNLLVMIVEKERVLLIKKKIDNYRSKILAIFSTIFLDLPRSQGYPVDVFYLILIIVDILIDYLSNNSTFCSYLLI